MTIDFDGILQAEMAWAMEQKRRLSVARQDDFQMRVSVVGQRGEIARTPIQWDSEALKRRVMRALSQACKELDAAAVVVASDVRCLNLEAFCAFFSIAVPKGREDMDAFERERQRVMEPYDFYMGNLPRELWEEYLMVFAHGPRVKRALRCAYRVEGGSFVFEPVAEDGGVMSIPMIPAWWV